MAITKHSRHNNCEVQIRPGCGPHHSELYCTRHGVHVQWLKAETAELLKGFTQFKAPKTKKGTQNVR